MEHRRMVVRGRVQGVWYRKHTREKALELGLRGWVMNQPDGSVLVEAEGDP
ncbi:MAG: acylphosphatase, partial [Flavobacteriales bacterium]|nr:acylphosphatase [Flavobacteriales bacterium]